MRKDFRNIDIYAGIHQSDGTAWLKENHIEPNWKKTWKGWNTWTSQPVFHRI